MNHKQEVLRIVALEINKKISLNRDRYNELRELRNKKNPFNIISRFRITRKMLIVTNTIMQFQDALLNIYKELEEQIND